jgi:anion-transporting  ArsA/GET3 family ATPase
MTLARLIAERRVVVCVGSGGVGKTTTAAALAVAAAREGRRTVVLTVDPAQRLKDALGIGTLDGRARRVPLGRGHHLDAMLLDVKRTFDELVRGLATHPEQAARVLENRLYQNLSSTLAGTAEYMAIESVQRLVEAGAHDLLVVDTPPARHAVDFLDAPRRLLALLDSRAFAILKDPTSILPAAGSRLAHMVLSGVLHGLERFTGVTLVREIGEFVAPSRRSRRRSASGWPRRRRCSRATRRASSSSPRRSRASRPRRPRSWRRSRRSASAWTASS